MLRLCASSHRMSPRRDGDENTLLETLAAICTRIKSNTQGELRIANLFHPLPP